jgi:UDP-glucose 4-epimerase
MASRSKRVLVTGAGGFIGNAALTLLARQGNATVGVGRHAPLAMPHGTAWMTLDLASLQARDALVSLPPFDTVVHCAAAIPHMFTGDSSRAAGEINAVIDQTMIDYCIRQSARLIYCSGTSVYGLASSGPISEDHSLDGAFSPYIQAKILSESRIRESVRSYVILRICAPYGASQSARTVLKIFIETAIAGGVLYYHGSGSREQDFVHVRDVAEAIGSAVAYTHVTNTFNIAGNSPISMKDLALMVVETIGSPSASVQRSGSDDVQENYRARFDISRAKRQLDWGPTVTLREGIREWAKSMGGRGA